MKIAFLLVCFLVFIFNSHNISLQSLKVINPELVLRLCSPKSIWHNILETWLMVDIRVTHAVTLRKTAKSKSKVIFGVLSYLGQLHLCQWIDECMRGKGVWKVHVFFRNPKIPASSFSPAPTLEGFHMKGP